MEKVKSWIGISLAVIVITAVFPVLLTPVAASPDTLGSQLRDEHLAYAKYSELQNRLAEHSRSFGDLKKLMEERVNLLPAETEELSGSSAHKLLPLNEEKMSLYYNLTGSYSTLWDDITIPVLKKNQARSEHLVGTKKRELQSRPFEDLKDVKDIKTRIEDRKELHLERGEMGDKSGELQPIVTFVHSSAGNEVTKFSSSFDIAPREESEMMMQGSGSFNLSGNYSPLWHQSLEANDTYAEIISDIDGDGLDDLLVSTVAHNLTPNTETVTVIAKKGTNGTHLWEQSVSGTEFGIVVYWVDDLDGDGLSDFIFQDWVYDSVTYTETAEIIAKRGYDGMHLWEQTISGEACYMYVDWIAELNGDGLDDVIVYEWVYNETADAETKKLIAKRGINGTHLWEQSVNASGYWNCDK